jgi:hypothetical protein
MKVSLVNIYFNSDQDNFTPVQKSSCGRFLELKNGGRRQPAASHFCCE